MKDISLTQSTIVQLSRVKFKVIPRESNESVLQSENTEHVFLKLQHPGFWMFLTVYSPSFSSLEWTRRVVLPFQQFYSLK
ncbi:TPA: hypothetical protein DEP21_00655 [Patescibacteria group bacterium]|nr:hypothetical protein [Candidatus Gracilibacteria bacterium]